MSLSESRRINGWSERKRKFKWATVAFYLFVPGYTYALGRMSGMDGFQVGLFMFMGTLCAIGWVKSRARR